MSDARTTTHKRRMLVLVACVVFVVVAIAGVALKSQLKLYGDSRDVHEASALSSNFVSGGEFDKGAQVHSKFGSFGGYSPLNLDVKGCQRGGDGIAFGLGHTEFLVLGPRGDKCVFRYGTEIENPNWDGELGTECAVPLEIGTVSLQMDDQGINFSPIVQYCSKR